MQTSVRRVAQDQIQEPGAVKHQHYSLYQHVSYVLMLTIDIGWCAEGSFDS